MRPRGLRFPIPPALLTPVPRYRELRRSEKAVLALSRLKCGRGPGGTGEAALESRPRPGRGLKAVPTACLPWHPWVDSPGERPTSEGVQLGAADGVRCGPDAPGLQLWAPWEELGLRPSGDSQSLGVCTWSWVVPAGGQRAGGQGSPLPRSWVSWVGVTAEGPLCVTLGSGWLGHQ